MLSEALQEMPDNILFQDSETNLMISSLVMCSEGDTQPEHGP